jgi:hypothetical protein
MTLGGGTDKDGRSAQILSKAFPFAFPALNIRISPITSHATSANGIFLEIEDIRIWHPIQNLTHRANGGTARTDQGSDSFASLSGHVMKITICTDKKALIRTICPTSGNLDQQHSSVPLRLQLDYVYDF